MVDEQLFLWQAGQGRRRMLVRDVADIKRLRVHLFTHWARPSVEFRVADLPLLESQRAQDGFARIFHACNCLIGELLGAVTLLWGSFHIWTSMRSWTEMWIVLLATLYAVLVGKGMELVWVRLKLLRVLRRLHRRLNGKEFDKVLPPESPIQPFKVEVADAATRDNVPFALPDGPRRPRVVLRTAADIDRLICRAATPWRLPRIEIRIYGLGSLDTQRAQTRVVRFCGGCNFLLAALLAVGVLLTGLLYQVWTESQAWFYSESEFWWLLKLDGSDVLPVVLAMLAAGLLGAAMEWVWLRARLIVVLMGIRSQIRA